MICRMCRAGKYVLFAGALAVGGLIAANRSESVTGSGIPGTEDRAIGAVDEVSLAGTGNLTIVQGNMPALTVTADDNLLALIETETSGRLLRIRPKSGYSLNPKTPLTYTLTIPQLEKVTLSGSGTVHAARFTGEKLSLQLSGSGNVFARDMEYGELSLSLSGSATAKLSGVAQEAKIRVSGSGDVDARELRSAVSEVRVSGSADVRVWATTTLNARVSGSADIRYRGEPKIEKRISGSGSVKQIKE